MRFGPSHLLIKNSENREKREIQAAILHVFFTLSHCRRPVFDHYFTGKRGETRGKVVEKVTKITVFLGFPEMTKLLNTPPGSSG